eukprot:TRINITY_DN31772_c0_g1_i2.p2 TRINITY_DN31772_c0_g1~~TRINITY_DN31772_c0_g1_i2.p2  ORF type:complete len:184 (-),score=35.72 TRINITY_DN31772_c0_g1_i2:11-562(-)
MLDNEKVVTARKGSTSWLWLGVVVAGNVWHGSFRRCCQPLKGSGAEAQLCGLGVKRGGPVGTSKRQQPRPSREKGLGKPPTPAEAPQRQEVQKEAGPPEKRSKAQLLALLEDATVSEDDLRSLLRELLSRFGMLLTQPDCSAAVAALAARGLWSEVTHRLAEPESPRRLHLCWSFWSMWARFV